MRIENDSLLSKWSSVTLNGNINGPELLIGHVAGLSLVFKWTGAGAAGSIKLQYSNDTRDIVDSSTVWIDVPSATFNISGAGQDGIVLSNSTFYKWIRPVFTFSSGTGTLTVCEFTTKGF